MEMETTRNHDSIPVARTSPALSPRRLTLLASVAAVGGALVFGGAGGYLGGPALTPPAQAAEQADQTARPAGFADLVAKVKPAVISVRVQIHRTAQATGSGEENGVNPFRGNAPLEKFFQQFGFPNGAPNAPQRRQVITGEGSGFFISADGYAVTNNHVVDHAKSVEVKTDDGKTYTAKVIGTDPKTDLALIK